MSSNIIPRFCLSHSSWRLVFSQLLSNLKYLISIPYMALSSLIHMGIMSIWSLFLFKKKLWIQSLNSSTTINQCHFPPILSCLNELISMNNLYPGLLGTCFSFFFGTFACLVFACAHISHGSSFPLSPLCPYFQLFFSEGVLQYVQSSGGISRLEYSFLVQSPHVLDPQVSVSLFPLAMMILTESFYQISC